MQAAVNIPQAEDLSMESISCLAVTTNGSVFYWRSIASSKSLVEINISSGHGDGDICVDVVAVDEGFLVGWMSGALSLLLPYQVLTFKLKITHMFIILYLQICLFILMNV